MNASETPTHRLVSHGVISAVCKLEFTCVTSTIAACLSARAASHGKLADGDAPCLRDAFRTDEIQTFQVRGRDAHARKSRHGAPELWGQLHHSCSGAETSVGYGLLQPCRRYVAIQTLWHCALVCNARRLDAPARRSPVPSRGEEK
jgi:hypothetical protein